MKLSNLVQLQLGQVLKLIIAIGVSLGAGVIGSVFTTPAVQSGWYLELVKPALNPPSWVFGPVWTTLYVLMGVALFLVWSFDFAQYKKQHSNILSFGRAQDKQNVRMLRLWKISIAAFFIQLFLNATWSIIFFGSHSPGWALIDIAALWLAIVWTMVVFYTISRPAVYLLVPYLLWVSFASYLNYSIWMLN